MKWKIGGARGASSAVLAGVLTLVCAAASTAAERYPERPIRMIVGFPPGGGVDLTARLLAADLGKRLKQSVVVENRTGAGGAIGAEVVASSAPDGYTLLLGNTGSLTINPALYPSLSYDSRKSFAPIALISQSPLLIMVNPASPMKTLAEFQAKARTESGAVSFGSGGTGSIGHLTGEILAARMGTKLLHVPYRGGSPAVTDLMGGQVDMVVEGIPLSAPLVRGGKLRALLVTAETRLPGLPDVPTAKEAGVNDYAIDVWYSLMAPASTPASVVKVLNEAVNAALQTPDMQAKLAEQGAQAMGGTPADVSKLIDSELARWKTAVDTAGVKAQ